MITTCSWQQAVGIFNSNVNIFKIKWKASVRAIYRLYFVEISMAKFCQLVTTRCTRINKCCYDISIELSVIIVCYRIVVMIYDDRLSLNGMNTCILKHNIEIFKIFIFHYHQCFYRSNNIEIFEKRIFFPYSMPSIHPIVPISSRMLFGISNYNFLISTRY